MAVNRRLVVTGLIVGGGAIAGYEIYKYQKGKKAAQQAATESAQAASGYGYGYGYGTSAGAYGYGGVTYGYGASGGFPAGYYGYGVPSPPDSAPGMASTTNAQWDQAAIQQLGQNGFDPGTVASALGAYLNGREVNSSQVNIIDAAIGVEGYPPVPGKNGNPPGIVTGGTTGGGQSGGKVAVPSLKGKSGEQARDELEHAGLKDAQVPATTQKGKSTVVTGQSPAAGRMVNKGSTVTVRVRTK